MRAGLLRRWLGIVSWQAGGAVLGVGAAALAATQVPPAVWGLYSLLLSAVQIAYGVGFAWLNHGLFRYARQVHAEQGAAAGVLAPIMGLHLTLLALIALGLFAAAPLAQEWTAAPPEALLWCFAALVALVTFEAFTYAAQAQGQFRGYGVGHFCTKLGPFIAAAAFLAVGGDALFLLAGAATGWLVAIIIVAPAIRWRGPLRADLLRPILRYAWRLPFGSAAGALSAWLGVWLVGAELGLGAAGVYAWAAGLFALSAALLVPLSAVLAPGLVDLRLAQDHAAMSRRIREFLSLALVVAAFAPVGLGVLAALGAALVPIHYAASVPVLVVLCAAAPAQLLAYALSPLLLAHETMVGPTTAGNVATAVLIAAGTAALLPPLGLVGAALATALAIWAASCLWLLLAGRLARPHTSAWAAWPLAGAFMLATALGLATLPPALALAAGAVASIVLLLAGRRLGWFAGVVGLAPHLPRWPLVDRGLAWCGGGR